MASLRECTRQVLDIARDGIGFITLWKEGRSWEVGELWPQDFSRKDGTMVVWDYDLEELKAIVAADPNAILVNSWYNNLGGMDELDRETLEAALRWQYETCHPLISDWEIREVAS